MARTVTKTAPKKGAKTTKAKKPIAPKATTRWALYNKRGFLAGVSATKAKPEATLPGEFVVMVKVAPMKAGKPKPRASKPTPASAD